MNAQPHGASASHAHPATRERRIEVVLVSGEDEFLIELGPMLGDRYRVHTVETPDAILAAAAGNPCFAIIDTANLGDGAAAAGALRAGSTGVPLILVTADRAASEPALRAPVVAVVARADIAGDRMTEALRKAEARLQPSNALVVAAAPAPASRRAIPKIAVAAALCAAVVLAGALWWVRHHGPTAARPAAARTAPGTTVTAAALPAASGADATPAPQSSFELLSAARVALHDQKLLPHDPPRGDSALELYGRVLAQEPHNDEAADGVRRLFSAGRPVIESDLAAYRFDEAGRLLGAFKAAGADPAVLGQLNAQLQHNQGLKAAEDQQRAAAAAAAAAKQAAAQAAAQQAQQAQQAQLARTQEAARHQAEQEQAAAQAVARAAAPPAPSPASAPPEHAVPAAPQFIRARTLGPLNVVYPPQAYQNKVSGTVTIEFTLHPDGSATDTVVVESTAKGPFQSMFERAAASAVLGGRYDASALSGGSQRARIRINFNPG